jgi:hypothetical protein
MMYSSYGSEKEDREVKRSDWSGRSSETLENKVSSGLRMAKGNILVVSSLK